MRLIDPAYTLSDNQKILQVVDNVERIYREGEDDKATQMINEYGVEEYGQQLFFTIDDEAAAE